jgi:hypothetical protein
MFDMVEISLPWIAWLALAYMATLVLATGCVGLVLGIKFMVQRKINPFKECREYVRGLLARGETKAVPVVQEVMAHQEVK